MLFKHIYVAISNFKVKCNDVATRMFYVIFRTILIILFNLVFVKVFIDISKI